MTKGDLVPDNEYLLRRVYLADKRYIKSDGRPSSRAFTPRPKDAGKLSVDIESLTTYSKAITDLTKFCLFRLKAEIVYQLNLSCIYDPLTIEEDLIDNPAHSIIKGIPEDDESIAAILARKSTRVINIV